MYSLYTYIDNLLTKIDYDEDKAYLDKLAFWYRIESPEKHLRCIVHECTPIYYSETLETFLNKLDALPRKSKDEIYDESFYEDPSNM